MNQKMIQLNFQLMMLRGDFKKVRLTPCDFANFTENLQFMVIY